MARPSRIQRSFRILTSSGWTATCANHVALGMGIDYCLGPLARAEARVTLKAFMERFSSIRPGTTPAVRESASPIVFGFRRLPLVLERMVQRLLPITTDRAARSTNQCCYLSGMIQGDKVGVRDGRLEAR